MATAAVILSRIEEAETARHALITGARVVEVTSPNGVKVAYQQADLAALQAYIDRLQTDLQKATTGNRRPVYISFGR